MGKDPDQYRSQSIQMNLIIVSFYSSEWFKTSVQQTDPVTAKSHQLPAKSKGINPDVDTVKLSSDLHTSVSAGTSTLGIFHLRILGVVPMIAQSMWCY